MTQTPLTRSPDESYPTLSGRPVDMTSLFQWSLSHATARDDTTRPSDDEIKKMRDNLDPKWVDVILGKDDAVRMRECFERALDTTSDDDVRTMALDELEMLVESGDNAKDFVKLNLVPTFLTLLNDRSGRIRMYAFWVLGTVVQNTPEVQEAVLKMPVLELALTAFQSDPESDVRSKALYFIMGELKLFTPAQEVFAKLNGHRALMDTMAQCVAENQIGISRKVVFLLYQMVMEHSVVVHEVMNVESEARAFYETCIKWKQHFKDDVDMNEKTQSLLDEFTARCQHLLAL